MGGGGDSLLMHATKTLLNSKLISELVQSDMSVFLIFSCNTGMANSDKENNLFAHAQLQYSVKMLKTQKRNITQTSKETNRWSFDVSFAGCLGT